MYVLYPGGTALNLVMLVFVEGEKPEYAGKITRSKARANSNLKPHNHWAGIEPGHICGR